MNPEKSIPAAVLKGARGLAILTVAKAGVLLSYKLGTGLVVARRPDGSWSAPSAILSAGLGWGAQVCFKSSGSASLFQRINFLERRNYIQSSRSFHELLCLLFCFDWL